MHGASVPSAGIRFATSLAVFWSDLLVQPADQLRSVWAIAAAVNCRRTLQRNIGV
jgi:hypothetical protein